MESAFICNLCYLKTNNNEICYYHTTSEILSANSKTLESFLAPIRQKMLENAGKCLIHCLSCDSVKIWCEGKFDKLITKANLDRRLAMVLTSKLLFLTDFGQKLDE